MTAACSSCRWAVPAFSEFYPSIFYLVHTQLAGDGHLFKLQVGIQSHSSLCD